MSENEIARIIVNSALNVHKELGPGLLESAYESCLVHELIKEGLSVETQKPLPLFYKGNKIDCGYRLDVLVEEKVVVEIKSIEELSNIHTAQLLTYLKLSNCHLGLLINFNVLLIKHGIKRIVNNLK